MTTTELADRYVDAIQALIAEEKRQYQASVAGEGLLSAPYHHAVLQGMGRALVVAIRLQRDARGVTEAELCKDWDEVLP